MSVYTTDVNVHLLDKSVSKKLPILARLVPVNSSSWRLLDLIVPNQYQSNDLVQRSTFSRTKNQFYKYLPIHANTSSSTTPHLIQHSKKNKKMADTTYAFGALKRLHSNATNYVPIITRTVVSFITTPNSTTIIPTITPTITAIITTTIVKNCSDVSISCERESAPQTEESDRAFFARLLDGWAIPVIILLAGLGCMILLWMIVVTINDCRRHLNSKE